MKIADPTQTTLVNEVKLMLDTLPFDGARVLELGCGKAEKTRSLAETGRVAEILALEVDAIQHVRNLQVTDLPNVRFAHGGAEAIPAEDNAFDIVIMLAAAPRAGSAHGYGAQRNRACSPGGLAWISEPLRRGAQ